MKKKQLASIRISISEMPQPAQLQQIAKTQGQKHRADSLRGLTNTANRAKQETDFFCVLAATPRGRVVGYVAFLQNDTDPGLWLYTDLWVRKQYRRRGIATRLVQTGLGHLVHKKATAVCCCTWPENTASVALQGALGFVQTQAQPFKPFNWMQTEGLLLFRRSVPKTRPVELVAADPKNRGLMRALTPLWVAYWKETTGRGGEKTEKPHKIRRRLQNRTTHAMQTPQGFFGVLVAAGELVGFAFFGVSGGIKSLGIPYGVGEVMDFYIRPQSRRQGYGRQLYALVEERLLAMDVARVYLTPDAVTGEPFWTAMGYTNSGMLDPGNHEPLYTKQIAHGVPQKQG